MTPSSEPLWTAREVAQHLAVSKQWVYRQAELGLLPCLRLSGGVIRFRPSAILDFLKARERPVASTGHRSWAR